MIFLVNLFLLIVYLLSAYTAEPQLRLLNIIFRHGDRTPTPKAMFPTDPYYNSDFYPYGLGGLTNTGKSRAYELGEFIRERYKNFLGDVYLPELLYARSTDYDRTKMSLQLVLVALFPPANVQKWHDSLNWQPIPITYVSKLDDDLLLTTHQSKFLFEKKRVEMSEEIQNRLEELRDFMYELSILTGRNVTETYDMKSIYETLLSEKYLNLSLPDWTNRIFSEGKLLDGVLLDYEIITYDKNITSSLGGKLMSKITRDILATKYVTKERMSKLYIYSAHETNIAAILRALEVFQTHIPAYTSAIIIELIEDEERYFIKVLYYHGISPNATELQLPNCLVLCPIEKYLSNVNDILEITENDQ